MTHYKMNSLHLGCGESLSTFYRRNEKVSPQRQDRTEKKSIGKKTKPKRQAR